MSSKSPTPCSSLPLPELLNRECRCIAVDESALRRELAAELEGVAPAGELLDERPHLLSPSPVFVSREQVERMAAVVRGVERVATNAGYREAVLAPAPPIARRDPGTAGVFFGYDFHLTASGPKLIEINTNAGGGLLGLHLARAQRGCCPEVERLVIGSLDLSGVEEAVVEMFRRDYRRQRGESAELRAIAVVDEDPAKQFLYPELLLFARLFERHGIAVRVADPRELEHRDGRLCLGELAIDLVYNRLTDFYLSAPENALLARAYEREEVVLTPGPHHHALFANKRNLALLSHSERLAAWGIDDETRAVLGAAVPHAEVVDRGRAESLWSGRRRLFFKPLAGYGSRGTYRGDKLTRRVWESILEADYLAQERVAPSERLVVVDGDSRPLKLDVRSFVYSGEIQFLGARLYQGQATNLRTAGGGLATVFTTPPPDPQTSADTDCC